MKKKRKERREREKKFSPKRRKKIVWPFFSYFLRVGRKEKGKERKEGMA